MSCGWKGDLKPTGVGDSSSGFSFCLLPSGTQPQGREVSQIVDLGCSVPICGNHEGRASLYLPKFSGAVYTFLFAFSTFL